MSNLKEPMIRSSKVLRSAKGQPCSIRLSGICNGNPETTVWCHLNGYRFGKGAGIKAHDVLGFHGCSDCHRYFDVGHGTKPMLTEGELLWAVIGAVTETWVRLIRAGTIIVPVDKETHAADRPVKPRAPKEGRTGIPKRADAWPPKGSRKLQSTNNLKKREAGR